jgi:hypothetical protein
MKKRKVFFGVLAAVMLFCAGGPVTAQTGSGPVIYVAGYESKSGKGIATVWKLEGSTVTPIALTDGTRDATVYGLAEIGGSIYAAGRENTGSGTWRYTATIWKIDGSTVTSVALPDEGTGTVQAEGVVESGGSIYAVGRRYNDTTEGALMWKIEGSTVTPIALTGGTRAWGIAESGDSIYAAGMRVPFGSRGAEPGIAMVWKIDRSGVIPLALTDGTDNASAQGIVESGGGIYAAGYKGTYYKAIPMVWKIDGSRVSPLALTDGTQGGYTVSGITAGGGSLYVAGNKGIADWMGDATVWKVDGSRVRPIVLTGTRNTAVPSFAAGGKRNVTVYDITAGGGGLYAAGSEEGSALVWKIDGSTVTPIPLPGGNSAYAVIVRRE